MLLIGEHLTAENTHSHGDRNIYICTSIVGRRLRGFSEESVAITDMMLGALYDAG